MNIKITTMKILINKLSDRILNKQFLYSCIIVFCTGFISRYLILIYIDVNVFTDISNIVSILYYGLMSVYIPFTRVVVSELCNPGVLMMEKDPVGGGGAGSVSNPSGTARGSGSGTGRDSITVAELCNPTDTGANPTDTPGKPDTTGFRYGPRGGRIHPSWTPAGNTTGLGGTLQPDTRQTGVGEIKVYDNNNQGFVYKTQETNQPLATNLANVIDHQSNLGTKLHPYYFNDKQQGFFFDLLRHEYRDIYDKIFTNGRGKPTTKPNWDAANSDIKRISDAFKKAK